MIAVVSSTIFPGDLPIYGLSRSVFSQEERLCQTRRTIDSLRAVGYSDVHLADNSGKRWVEGTETALYPATIHRFAHYQFKNKGIGELYMLLELLGALPDDTSILKISGRYCVRKNIADQLGSADVAAKWDPDDQAISTRGYMVRDKRVYQRFLEDTLDEVYAYSTRIGGPRSLMRILRNSMGNCSDESPYFDPPVSIERAAARALKRKKYALSRLTELALEGYIATSRELIRE